MKKNSFETFLSNNEIHCFVIWNKGLFFKIIILDDIFKKFNILLLKNLYWSKQDCKINWQYLYKWQAPYFNQKLKECGYGNFLFIMVEDKHPIYEKRKPYKIWVDVNIKMYECKYLYRDICNANLIHATNDKKEAYHDLMFFYDYIKDDIVF